MAFVVTQRFAEQSSEIATLLDGTQLVFSQVRILPQSEHLF